MNNKGYIKIDRQITDWGWWTDDAVFRIFIGLIILANYKDSQFKMQTVKRGSFVTSIEKLCTFFGVGESKLRRCLKCLCKTGEITDEPTNKYRLITIVNYDMYQGVDNILIPSESKNKPRNKSKNKSSNKPKNKSKNNPQSNQYPIKERNKSISSLREDILDKKKKAASPARLEGGGLTAEERKKILDGIMWRSRESFDEDTKNICWGDLPNYAPVRMFSRAMNGDDYAAGEFYNAFRDSKTLLPPNWRDIYYRFYKADPENRRKFITALSSGEYREKWGSSE